VNVIPLSYLLYINVIPFVCICHTFVIHLYYYIGQIFSFQNLFKVTLSLFIYPPILGGSTPPLSSCLYYASHLDLLIYKLQCYWWWLIVLHRWFNFAQVLLCKVELYIAIITVHILQVFSFSKCFYFLVVVVETLFLFYNLLEIPLQ